MFDLILLLGGLISIVLGIKGVKSRSVPLNYGYLGRRNIVNGTQAVVWATFYILYGVLMITLVVFKITFFIKVMILFLTSLLVTCFLTLYFSRLKAKAKVRRR
ncbi:MAG: hypothetical protein SF123_16090 [Chloroflexota bacterium]|nr:hypothetical protein [Chloroflexota bacterium]